MPVQVGRYFQKDFNRVGRLRGRGLRTVGSSTTPLEKRIVRFYFCLTVCVGETREEAGESAVRLKPGLYDVQVKKSKTTPCHRPRTRLSKTKFRRCTTSRVNAFFFLLFLVLVKRTFTRICPAAVGKRLCAIIIARRKTR